MQHRNTFVFFALLCLSVLLASLVFLINEESNPGARPLFHYGPVQKRFGFGTYWRRSVGMRDASENYSLYDREFDIYVVILAEESNNQFSISGGVVDSDPTVATVTFDLADSAFKKTVLCSQSSVVIVSGTDITVYQMRSRPVVSEYHEAFEVPCILDTIRRTDQPEDVVLEFSQNYRKYCRKEN